MRIHWLFLSCLIVAFSHGHCGATEPLSDRLVYRSPVAEGDFAKLDLDRLTMRLIDVLQQMHVETDPNDPQFGMIYETFDPERKIWVEGEGRDTMHHMMWTMVGLANAYRASGNPKVRDFLFDYPYAFYLRMMLGGEKYFGPEYGNGFCPYYWDDGDSVNITDYFHGKFGADVRINGHSPMSSIHLAEDLSLGHLDLWWLSSDPRVKQVTADLYHQVHYGKTAERFAARNYALNVSKEHPRKDLVKFRAAEVKGKEMLLALTDDQRRALYEKEFPPQFGPVVFASQKLMSQDGRLPAIAPSQHKVTDNLAWLRLREQKSGGIPAYPDDQAFAYYITLANQQGERPFGESFARWFTMWFLARSMLNEYWMDDAPYHHGFAHFPGVGSSWDMKEGRFQTYHSQTKQHFWHTRSLHFAWMSAIGMQMMDQWPEMHETFRREAAGDDPVIRFTDDTPKLDGRRDDEYTTVFENRGLKMSLASDPLSLFVLINGHEGKELAVVVHGTERRNEERATIRLASDGSVTVVNAENQPLVFWSQTPADGIEIQIPYMVNRIQKDWLTAVEHGRHHIEMRIGRADADALTRNVYFLSSARRIKDQLRASVEGAIVNHAKILDEQGWLPYAVADKSRDGFTRLSFSGAYGHLIHTIAQYQIFKQGRRDWELKRTVHVDSKR